MPDIEYATPHGPLPGYLSIPSGTGPWPGVVVIQDAFGMTDDLRAITDRFAANGYLALAPALYERGRKPACIVRTVRALMSGEGAAVDDIIAARDHLKRHTHCTGKVGSVGFCMGGGFCLVLAGQGVFDATAPNYGGLPKDVSSLAKSCPVVASYGAKDRGLRGAAQQLDEALAPGDVPRDVKEYPNVGHSFMNDWNVRGPLKSIVGIAGLAYSAPEAEDAWQRILTFFGEHLQ